MPKDTEEAYKLVTKILSNGAMGLEYVHFDQDQVNDQHIHKSLKIIGDMGQGYADSNIWDKGICFGLSSIYLGCTANPVKWKSKEKVIDELKNGVCKFGCAPGAKVMERNIASAFVAQKEASLIDRSKANKATIKDAKEANQKVSLAITERVNKGLSANRKAAIRDHLLEPFGLVPSPKGKNVKIFELKLDSKGPQNFKPQLSWNSISPLVEHIAQKDVFSLVSLKVGMMGHETAALGDKYGAYFFDPCYGQVKTGFNRGMKMFLQHAIAFFHIYQPGGDKSSTTFMNQSKIPASHFAQWNIKATVYQYKKA